MKAFSTLGLDNIEGRLFGLEVEAEGDNLPSIEGNGLRTYWRQIDDGSLRGEFPDSRSEYVSRVPLTKDVAIDSLKLLYEAAVKNKTIWDFSFRTSFHVHINILDLEEDQVLNIIYAYRLLESALFYKCSDSRKNNRFCLRANDSDHFIDVCDKAFSMGLRIAARAATEQDLRYSSLNFASLTKHGTLEFRCKNASPDVNDMIDWVETLDSMVNWAISFKSPLEIFEFVQKHPGELAKIVLGIQENLQDFERDLSLSLQIPFLYRALVAERDAVDLLLKNNKVKFNRGDAVYIMNDLNNFDIVPGGQLLNARVRP